MPETFSIVCLSSQDWATPLPTNRQQIMRRAAAHGHEVLFVETGEFLGRHLVRLVSGPGRSSLAKRMSRGEEVEPGIRVRKSLNLLPWGQRFELSNRVNGIVSRIVLRRGARRLPAPRVTWLYDPRTTWAIGRLGDAFGVYDCVDDYAQQAAGRRNRILLAAADARAAKDARVVFATTRALHDRHLRVNASTRLVGNAADFEHFAPAADRQHAAPELAGLPRPVLGFAGNIAVSKVDLELLDALARADSTRTVLLAGPVEAGHATRLSTLAKHANVIWIGPVPYEELPRVVAAFDVGLIPYAENDYTRNVFPLKLYEYFAAGKPVVATGLPEVAGLEPDCVLAHGHEHVERAVAAALELMTHEDVQRRQAIGARNTWDARTERLLSLVTDELSE